MTKLNLCLLAFALVAAIISANQNWIHDVKASWVQPGTLSLKISTKYDSSKIKFYSDNECTIEHVVTDGMQTTGSPIKLLLSAGVVDVYFKNLDPESEGKCNFLGTYKLSDSKPYLGFSYDQSVSGIDWLTYGWTNNKKYYEMNLRRDLSILSGLGVNSLLLSLNPNQIGIFSKASGSCQKNVKNCQFEFEKKKIEELIFNLSTANGVIDIIGEFNIQSSIAFDGSYFFSDDQSPRWGNYFGRSKEGWQNFAMVAASWIESVAGPLEASPIVQQHLVFYDLWKNFSYLTDKYLDSSLFFKILIDGARGISNLKKAISLDSLCDLEKLKADMIGSDFTFNNIIVKSNSSSPGCSFSETSRAKVVRKYFPTVFGVISEIGSFPNQVDEVVEFKNEMLGGAYAAIRGNLWSELGEGGVGKNPDHLYQLFGKYTDQFPFVNMIPNGGDFENLGSEKGWIAEGGQIQRLASTDGTPATGNYFLRYSGHGQFCSPPLFIVNKIQIGVTANVRISEDKQGYISFVTKQSTQKFELKGFNGPAMRNIHGAPSNGFLFSAKDGSRFGRICFGLTSESESGRIDIDAISVSTK